MSGMGRVIVIWNEAAGQKDGGDGRRRIERRLHRQASEFVIRDWEGGDELAGHVHEAIAGNYDLLLVAGGDGTIRSVADILLRSRSTLPLAILPKGSANVLARALGYPTDSEEALEAIEQGAIIKIDAGLVTEADRHFLISTSIGAHAELVRETSREMKRELGFLAYVTAVFRTIVKIRPRRVTLDFAGRRRRWRTSSILVTNTGVFLPMRNALEKEISERDGRLDLIVTRRGTILDLVGLLLHAIVGKRFDPWRTEHIQVEEVRIEAADPMPVQIDGEPLGQTPVTIQIQPQAVRVVAPQPVKDTNAAATPRPNPATT